MKKVKTTVKKYMQNNKLLYKLYKKIVFTKRKHIFNSYCRTESLKEKAILFEAFQGRKFACSPMAMFLEAVNDPQYADYEFIWAFRNPQKYEFVKKYPRTRIVKYNTRSYLKVCASVKYWITNSTMQVYMTPRKDQVFVQTWHGTPLKRLGCDIEVKGNVAQSLSEIYEQYKSQGKKITYFLSPSKFYTEKIASAYNISGADIEKKFLEIGYPRNDFLVNFTQQDVSRIKAKYKIPENKKVILYAPTFRDNNFERGKGFHYDLGIDFDMLKKELSDEFVILFRTHYFIVDNFDITPYRGFIYDVSKLDDINELYVISDMLITDYSSVFFDYANLKRPIMFFMYDFEQYKEKMRDFYFGIEELPGPIVYDNSGLCETIKATVNDFVYDEKYRAFNEKFNPINDGQSSKRALGECIK